MKYALVNPNWDFRGSTYFGCREPHYPLELLFAGDKIREAGHDALLVDAQTDNLDPTETRSRVHAFAPDFLVIPTAPSYLFWRCPPPEVRVPRQWFAALDSKAVKVAIGPHTSATPLAALRKLNVQVGMRGEAEWALAQLASQPWSTIDGCCWRDDQGEHLSPALGVVEMKTLRALDFKNYNVENHSHRHHVFSGQGRGAELEFARGCPWACNFCNKTLFRNKFRERDVDQVLLEIDRLIARGVDYVYFIDEIFGVGKNVRRLLEGIAERELSIGFQSRIDLWDEESLDLLGRAHCISMECGIESITALGRDQLNKGCRMSTERMTELLIYARQRIPWVQANLILTEHDDKNQIRRWQEHLKSHQVWVSEPVPMFPFPGTPLYAQMFGPPDDRAWERAHHHYLSAFSGMGFSDIQEQRPAAIEDLGMHVLVTADTVGGVWTYTRELVTGLARRGVRVTLVSFGEIPISKQCEWMDGLRGLDFRPTAFRLEWMQESEQDLQASSEFLLSLAGEIKPDLAHFSQYCYGALQIALPRLVVAHSDVISWWQSVHGEEPRETRWIRSYRETVERGIAGATALVAPSRWMLDSIVANYTRPAQSAVIYNGRNPGLFNPHSTKEDLALCVGRLWDSAKQVTLLSQCDHKVPIVIAGSDKHPDEVVRGARPAFPARRRVQFRGPQSEAQLAQLYGRACMYVATPQYEPFGLAPLEAAFSRCAIVANDIPTFHEVWGDTACYFRYNHAEDLARTLARLQADRELRLTYANLAYHRARQRYTAERMVDDYMNLYASLVPAGAAVA